MTRRSGSARSPAPVMNFASWTLQKQRILPAGWEKKIKLGDQLVDAYFFCLGGAVGEHQNIARLSGYRCIAQEVPAAIERLLTSYIAQRHDSENLRAYFSRHSNTELRAQLAGEEIIAVSRDLSPGPVPHGVAEEPWPRLYFRYSS